MADRKESGRLCGRVAACVPEEERGAVRRGAALSRRVMALWMAAVLADPLLALALGGSLPGGARLAGCVFMVLAALAGMGRHLPAAAFVMQINMAVSVLQFCLTLFFYRSQVPAAAVIVYGAVSASLIAGSLTLYAHGDVKAWRRGLELLKAREKSGVTCP